MRWLRWLKSHAFVIVMPLPPSVYGTPELRGAGGNGRTTGLLFVSHPPSVPAWKRMLGGASASRRCCGVTPSAGGKSEKAVFQTSCVVTWVLITLAAPSTGICATIEPGPVGGSGGSAVGVGVGVGVEVGVGVGVGVEVGVGVGV